MHNFRFSVVIEKDEEGYTAFCPDCGYTIEFDNLIVDKEGTFIVPGEEMTNG